VLSKILFAPLSIIAGIVAGMLSRRAFDFAWGHVDNEEPPAPSHHRTSWGKVLGAAALQGIVYAVVRALTDRAARTAFFRFTGVWPGEEERDVVD
jgi:Protein of unknown function (DUF4235)